MTTSILHDFTITRRADTDALGLSRSLPTFRLEPSAVGKRVLAKAQVE